MGITEIGFPKEDAHWLHLIEEWLTRGLNSVLVFYLVSGEEHPEGEQ